MPQVPLESIWSARDQESLFYRCYPGDKSDYYFSIIHGFAEHSGRYAQLIECLRATGRAVFVHDLRGHGRSGGARGSLKYWGQYWEDFQGLRTHIQLQRLVPVTRTIIIGHSLGGLIALEGAAREGKDVSGLILSSPCLGLPLPPALIFLNTMIAKVIPDFSYSRPVNPADLSRDAAVCQAYADDPLIFKNICAKTLREIVRAGDLLAASPLHISMPAWFFAAGNERVVNLKRTLSIYAQLDSPFKKLKIFEDFRHEIFNEVQRQIAYDSVLQAVEQIVEFNSRSRKK